MAEVGGRRWSYIYCRGQTSGTNGFRRPMSLRICTTIQNCCHPKARANWRRSLRNNSARWPHAHSAFGRFGYFPFADLNLDLAAVLVQVIAILLEGIGHSLAAFSDAVLFD